MPSPVRAVSGTDFTPRSSKRIALPQRRLSPTTSRYIESGFVERSRDEYMSHHFDEDAKFAKTVTRKVLKHEEKIAESMALIMEETETSGSYEGKPVKLIGTETAVLRLNAGNWQIVHIHWSSRKPKP